MREELAAVRRLGGLDPFLNGARAAAIARWGPGVASAVAAAAMRFPTRTAISDEQGDLSYRALDRQATNLAAWLRRRAGDGSVAILARNHAGFLVGQVAVERAGRDLVLVSTALPAPNLEEVLRREGVTILIADAEFAPLIAGSGTTAMVISADGVGPDSLATIGASFRLCAPPTRRSRLVLLTSGTTGPPKGARRPNRAPRANEIGMVTRIPYQVGDLYYVAPPLFHAWGLSQATAALATASTIILRRRFTSTEAVELLTRRPIDVLAVVPLMLRRILNELTPPEANPRHPHPDPDRPHRSDHDRPQRPRIVVSSGNVLPGGLAVEWMDRFGDRLFNVYGSTEAALGTIAGPAELRAAPGTVGRPPRGVTLAILDDGGMPVPVGTSGRVFLGSSLQFGGYTDGTTGDRSGTMLATGDMGWLDDDGLLHIRGRANDRIVTGGENVYPSRVEEVLDRLAEVEQSAVVGVDDDEYGQRIVAFVVPRQGRTIDTARLREEAALELPSFMVPREVFVVGALPMTTTGKVIRHRLAVLGDVDRV